MSTPPVTRHPIDAELLDRYLARLTTPAESEHVQRWMASHPDHAIVVGALQTAPLRTDGGELTTDTESWLARINIQAESLETLANRRQGQGNQPAAQRSMIRPRAWFTSTDVTSPAVGRPLLGAGVSTREKSAHPALKGIGVLGTRTLRRTTWFTAAMLMLGIVGLTWTVRAHYGPSRIAMAPLTYTTGNGERATITLPDGGTVALNVASRLEVPMDYMAGHRTVRLVGEGLFTVSHHVGTPLTVMAGGTAARVLGTSFVMRRYQTDTATVVAVRDGKVAVGSAIVTAAHMAEVGRDGVPHLHPAASSLFTFATGVLTLDWVPLPAAIVELDRWYDADIRLGDPRLAMRSANGKVGAGSLSDLAELLKLAYDVRVVRDGRVLTLFPR